MTLPLVFGNYRIPARTLQRMVVVYLLTVVVVGCGNESHKEPRSEKVRNGHEVAGSEPPTLIDGKATGFLRVKTDSERERQETLRHLGFYESAKRDCSALKESRVMELYELKVTTPTEIAIDYAATIEQRGRAQAFKGCLAGLPQ